MTIIGVLSTFSVTAFETSISILRNFRSVDPGLPGTTPGSGRQRREWGLRSVMSRMVLWARGKKGHPKGRSELVTLRYLLVLL